ncbi:MAG: hypothetical protein JRC68_05265 [Deltaproteobacteria bacterium]|nr:hypothetical protein [Deltaproteobacteria bacterium]
MSSIFEVIENKGLDLEQTDYYAAILGESPSKGAKSPSLWNAAFKGLNLSGFMHPMDILPEKLEEVVKCLRQDNRFIGGAVTMPYKIDIIPYLDDLESEAETIGAVNCIYRDKGKLIGSNTDGAGALWSLEKEIDGSLSGKTVLQIGTGGAGFAVASYLASVMGVEGCLILANRSNESRDEIAGKLQGKCRVKSIDWPISSNQLDNVDIIVNCSSIGFETLKEDDEGTFSLKYYSPLGPVNNLPRVEKVKDAEKQYLRAAIDSINKNFGRSLRILAAADNPFVFDIIYQPTQTVLLFQAKLVGCKTLNGVPMNLEQAVIAFDKATVAAGLRSPNSNEIRDFMSKVR